MYLLLDHHVAKNYLSERKLKANLQDDGFITGEINISCYIYLVIFVVLLRNKIMDNGRDCPGFYFAILTGCLHIIPYVGL